MFGSSSTNRSRFTRQRLAVALVLLLALITAACDGIGDPGIGTTTTAEPPQETTSSTEAVETTVTTSVDTTEPAPTDPDEGTDEEGTTPWWLLILAGVALIALIVAFVSRGSKTQPPVPVPGRLTWKDHATAGYAGARWAYDALSEDVAIWRGNAQFEATTEIGATAGTTMAETWAQLGPRIDAARESLYALEASSPDPRTAEMARSVITTMLAVRTAVDARAEARYAYRTAEQSATESPSELIEARDREIRSSTNFNSARSDFAEALSRFSTIA
jgi:hypothetical protein